jgi:hypothetical protein
MHKKHFWTRNHPLPYPIRLTKHIAANTPIINKKSNLGVCVLGESIGIVVGVQTGESVGFTVSF